MDAAERVMISCLLLDAGGEADGVAGFLSALEEGLSLGESDAEEMLDRLRERLEGPLPAGAAGDVIRVMKAHRDLSGTLARFGMACRSLEAAAGAVAAHPGARGLAARMLLAKAEKAARRG